ncbi:hypothetical protein M378DRAFT_161354 [Amanita muscaria Koide BX008]|uniref:Uncharacterized protein n=1 Tax=Amanita muscaria (strain Koide BX008) TaxID=946122 RepID=A0A0C2WWC6_AMAMK|nr:hypothetical protein M378DRAFT_161354 [Amanita muscaria Koide BX008]
MSTTRFRQRLCRVRLHQVYIYAGVNIFRCHRKNRLAIVSPLVIVEVRLIDCLGWDTEFHMRWALGSNWTLFSSKLFCI